MSTSNPALMPSRGIEDIASRAMLVNVTLQQFNPTKHDKGVTAEVATAHGSDISLGKYQKTIVSKKAVEAIRALAGEIRSEHYRRTLAWSDEGDRILTSVGFDAYAEFMRQSEARWEAGVELFMSEWDQHVAEARIKLNGLFKESDYPSKDALLAKFKFRWNVKPVPLADDFRVALGATEVSAIKNQIQYDLRTTVDDAMQSVWGQMQAVVKHMAEKLKAYNPNAKDRAEIGIFRETLVTNITDLLAMIPSLNLTNDPKVTEFAERMRDLTRFDAEKLRDSSWRRDETAKAAQSILDQMSAFIA